MSEASLHSPQVRVDALPAAYHAVVEAVQALGLSAAEMTTIFDQHVAAECLQCGIQISGEQLSRLAHAAEQEASSDPLLARLQQGYCARKDCTSYYYRFVFRDHPKVEWERVAAVAAGAGARAAEAPTQPPPAASGPRFWYLQDQRTRRVIIGIGVLLALLVLRYFSTGGRVPFVHQAPKYVVDPASVTDQPFNQAPPKPATNRVVR